MIITTEIRADSKGKAIQVRYLVRPPKKKNIYQGKMTQVISSLVYGIKNALEKNIKTSEKI
jgi:hypothetical protein